MSSLRLVCDWWKAWMWWKFSVIFAVCFNCLSLVYYEKYKANMICIEFTEGSLCFSLFCQTSPVSNSKTESRYGLDPQLLPSVVNQLALLFCNVSFKTAQVWLHCCVWLCCFVSVSVSSVSKMFRSMWLKRTGSSWRRKCLFQNPNLQFPLSPQHNAPWRTELLPSLAILSFDLIDSHEK